MTDETRRNVFRYGIAIDLVILAAGVGLLIPTSPMMLVAAFAVASALSVVRGGWQGGLLAGFLSLFVLALMFPDVMRPAHLISFIGLALLGGTGIALAMRSRTAVQPTALAAAAQPVAVPADGPVADAEPETFAQKPLERGSLAEVVPLRQVEPAPAEAGHEGDDKKNNKRRTKGSRRQPDAPHEGFEHRIAALRAESDGRARVDEERARELEPRLQREREEARLEQERIEAERRAAEEARAAAEAERLRIERELERARLEQERIEAERREAEAVLAAAEAERQRLAVELEERIARERETARLEHERIETQRRAAEEARIAAEAERQRVAAEMEARIAREREEARHAQERIEAERQAAEEARRRAEADRLRMASELEDRLAQERVATERDLHERLEAERRAAEEDLRRQLEAEREAMRARAEQEFAAERERLEREAAAERERFEKAAAVERERLEKEAGERVAAAQRAAEAATANVRPRPAEGGPSLISTISGWFKREPASGRNVNLKTKRLPANGNSTATRRPSASPTTSPAATGAKRAQTGAAKPRLLLIEKRRTSAEALLPKLRQRGVEVEVVERWVDAVDEIFRFRPSAVFLDVEHAEFEKIQKTLSDKSSQLPLVLTGRAAGLAPAGVRYAAFVSRPYDLDEVQRLAQLALSRPEDLLAEQSMPRAAKPANAPLPQVMTPSKPAALSAPKAPVAAPAAPRPAIPVAAKVAVPVASGPAPEGLSTPDHYEVTCFSCRSRFDAVESDWCSCLAKERSLVCTNCLSCFCKAAPAYKEKFWVEAPPRLFERKTAEARRQDGMLPSNPPKEQVVRPLVLAVEDDEDIQAIVQRVCSNLGYGFIWANNGQDGLEMAREYRPNLILSDAFMPKLDGREMCRILKEEPIGADIRMVVMTGLYTDTKYRSEAVKRFHIDDYIAKPVAITDLINLLQKHLEGVTGLPAQEDLHELHRQEFRFDDEDGEISLDTDQDVELADVLPTVTAPQRASARERKESYDVSCFNCQLSFDASRAEWCSCVGRDNTLVCEHCQGCFCKAPAAYRERFWIDAPPSLFERKMIGSKRALSNGNNPPPAEIKRPLILLVEDDENVQLIVRTVVSSMGYGFVVGANGQEGLTLAREYNPDLILSDAFMPKLDGREMCRLLKEDPATARAKAIIMTGLYTDRKYRNEALDYFKVDDYVAKPLAVDDLIKLFKKHLPQEVTAN